jgi:hypothetical protein
MHRSWATFVGIISLSLFLYQSTQAAEVGCDDIYEGNAHRNEEQDKKLWPGGFRPEPGMCISGYLRGNISKGDFDKVRDLLAASHPFTTFFYLLSIGGDVDEAIKIGTLFRKYLIYARAPTRFSGGDFYLPLANRAKCKDSSMQNCSCASACALIWFGAPDRFGIVGLHRPRTTDPAFAKLLPQEAANVYNQKLDAIVQYLNKMEVPKPKIDAMVATSSADIRWASAEDAHEGLEQAPSFAEWISATCGQMSTTEHETQRGLEMRKSRLTSTEALLLKMLTEKHDSRNACQRYLITSARERLPRPQ